MKESVCIVIDDTVNFINSATITNLRRRAYNDHSIDIQFEQLNPKDSRYINDEDGSINIDLVLKELNTSRYFKRDIQLVLCDYNLGDDNINGFEIIRYLRNDLRTRKKIILYSSNIDDVINRIIANGSIEDRIARIKDLVRSQITEFCKRDAQLQESIIKNLKEEMSYSISNFIITQLYRYGNFRFGVTYDKFENKTLQEVADVLSTNASEKERFEKEILDQTIAYLIKVEND